MSEQKNLHELSAALSAVLSTKDKTAALMSIGSDVGLVGFDWMKWPDSRRYVQHPHLIEQADELTCRRVLITLIRGERFNEGMIEEASARGLLTALAGRVQQLAEEQAPAR